jgi:hypothetical protein
VLKLNKTLARQEKKEREREEKRKDNNKLLKLNRL